MGPEPPTSKSDAERRRAKPKPPTDALQDIARPVPTADKGGFRSNLALDLDDWYENAPCTD